MADPGSGRWDSRFAVTVARNPPATRLPFGSNRFEIRNRRVRVAVGRQLRGLVDSLRPQKRPGGRIESEEDVCIRA